MKKKRVWIKFSELSSSDKVFRIINLVLMVAISCACFGMAIYYGTVADPRNRLPSAITMGFVVLLPLLAELIFRMRFNSIIFLAVELYALVAGFFGSVMGGYQRFDWLDIVVHTMMGYIACLIAIFVISRITDYKKLNVWTVILFCFCFSLALELCWELMEWFSDLFLGQVAQGFKATDSLGNLVLDERGRSAPFVTDTMEDILCNTCGAIVFCLHYLIAKLSKVSLGMKTIEKGLTERKVKYIEIEDKKEKTGN